MGHPPSKQSLKRYSIRSIALLAICILLGVIITAFVTWIIGNYIYGTEERHVPSAKKTDTGPSASDLILPTSVYPINYDLVIKTYLPGFGYKEKRGENKSLTFDAQVIIQLNITKTIRKIILNSLDLRFSESKCTFTVDGQPVGVQLEVNKDFEKVFFNLDKAVEPTDKAVLKIVYNGDLRTDMAGLYQTTYTNVKGEQKMAAVTQMEPISARNMVPCFDEPAFKASWTVTVIHPTGTTAIANGMEEKSEDLGDNFISSKFQTTPRMSSYLLAIFVSEFEYNERHTKSGVRFRVWSRPEEKNSTVYALEAGVKCLEFFENYYNIPFPLAKQDMVAVPDFAAGAMENWGLITYREDSLLYDPRIYTGAQKRRVAVVIAHELAHQWFGNLVTLKWWNDLWLNEGFATLAEYLGTDEISDGNFRMNEWFTMDALWIALEADSIASTHPMTFQIDKAIEVLDSFDYITYLKGGSVISMLRKTIGEDNFNTAINHYLNEHKYKNAEAADLFNAIAAMLPDDVRGPNGAKLNMTEFSDPWTKQLGYPLLTATRVNSSTIKVEQKRFKLLKSAMEEEKYRNPKWGFKWDVPVWYQSVGSKIIEMKWMKSNEPLFIHSEQPVILNADSNGFYRGGYSTELWQQIIKLIKEDHLQFSTQTRVRLIDDSFAGANAGLLNYSIPLDLLMYLKNEQDYIPWSGALQRIRELDDKYGTVREKDSFHKFFLALSLKTPAKKDVDFVSKNYLDDKKFFDVSAAQGLILNDCFMGDSSCGENMVKLFNKEVIGKCDSGRILSECSQ
uniref:Aminopeptidase n=1 Tax=Caenorhabditis japonica TaxID=281687 RepID=A0A8R1DUX5_CAEJA